MVSIERHAGNDAGELRTTTVHNAISICGVRGAQNRERNPTMPEEGSRDLPAVESVGKVVAVELEGKLIDILSAEIVADVVVAGTIVAHQFARERSENPTSGELQEAAVGDGVHAAAEGVVELTHEAVSHGF